MSRRFIYLLALLVFMLALSTACNNITDERGPTEVAVTWYGAVITLQQSEAEGLVCQRELEDFSADMSQGGAFLSAADFFEGKITVSLDLSGVDFTIEEERDSWAMVSAQGEVRLAVGEEARREPVEEIWYMRRSDRGWRWCGRVEPIVPGNPVQDGAEAEASPAHDEEALRRSGLFALNSLETFRYSGEWVPDLGNSGETSPFEGVVTASGEANTLTVDRGVAFSWIEKDGSRCTREAEEEWSCDPIGSGPTVFEAQVEVWVDMLTRQNSLYQYGYRQDSVDGKACHLFYRTGNGWESLCLDVESLYPLRHSTANFDPAVNDRVVFYWNAYQTDHNEPVNIKLPSN